jgi:hypothetical protein
MKNIVVASALAVAAAAPALAADIGVSISIAQPGVYGRIDIGNVPPPVVYAQPVVIVPGPYAVQRQPIYLYVPLEHQRHWSRYCSRYAACGQPVYFVQERWVRDRWEASHRGRPPGHDRGKRRGDDRDQGRDNRGHRR